jgi:hypothetical protein
MAKLKILVWESKDPSGEPDVEVIIPSYLVKWAPRMMKFMPRSAKEEVWGTDINWEDFNLDEMMNEAIEQGESELVEVKTKDAYVKMVIEE